MAEEHSPLGFDCHVTQMSYDKTHYEEDKVILL